eukprot:GHRR01036714.1.p1 GENE.GHRR01036714.1~~GHRR01036714.1.p1  ORF type:complete len:113 (+),score=35.43 GHRR01036714.1:198-536(+)
MLCCKQPMWLQQPRLQCHMANRNKLLVFLTLLMVVVLTGHRYNITRKHMEQLVESIQSLGYHYVLIDCPAGIDVGFINAISPAKEALIVTTPEITSIRYAQQPEMLLLLHRL